MKNPADGSVFRMSMLCITAVVALYTSHRFRTPRSTQSPAHMAKQMIPRDILGDIGFPREMKLFVTNMSIFHSLFARGGGAESGRF